MDNNEINKCQDLSGKKISSPNGNRMASFITSHPWLSGSVPIGILEVHGFDSRWGSKYITRKIWTQNSRKIPCESRLKDPCVTG